MYILHIPSWFPDESKPFTGNFIEKHIEAISLCIPSVTLRVEKTVDPHKPMEDRLLTPNNRLITYYVHQKEGFLHKFRAKIMTQFMYQKGSLYIEKNYGIPALIHLHVALPMGDFALLLKKRWHIPLMLSEHWSVYHPENYQLISNNTKRKLHRVISKCDGLTTVSNHLMNAIKNLYPIKQGFVISNVCNTDLFVPDQTSRTKKQIIHISTLDHNAKNFIGIINVIKEIKSLRDDFVLNVISEFEKPEMVQFVKENQLDDCVHFLGRMPENEVAETLGKNDFLLLFSNYENQPCVILEAFSCGLPVIATTVGGIPEIVNDERGVLVPRKDEQALKDAILKMLDEHTQYNKTDIRDYAVHNFSPDQIGNAFHHIYKMLLAH